MTEPTTAEIQEQWDERDEYFASLSIKISPAFRNIGILLDRLEAKQEHLDSLYIEHMILQDKLKEIAELPRYDLDEHSGYPNQHSDGDWVDYLELQAIIGSKS